MTKEEKLQLLRAQRDAKLINSDWTQLVDAAVTSTQKKKWKEYRQELRDIPTKYNKVSLVKWPTKPEIDLG